MTLRDAVTTASNSVSSAAHQLGEESSDPERSPGERRRAFRQLTELEVGDTWMRRSRALERDFDRPRLYLKFEGDNPSGTQKDRIAFAHVEDALSQDKDTIALATCGNYGVAVSLAASLAGITCRVFVPAGYHTKRLAEMEKLGAILERPEGSYEEVVAYSTKVAEREGWYDANPGDKNTALQLKAYSHIAHEIVNELGRAPATCAVPVSNGTLFAGIYQGFVELHKANKIKGLPRMIAASSTRKNPIVSSFLAGLRECRDLDPAAIRETTINEPLINWHSFDGQEALDAIWETNGRAHNISDEQMRRMSTYLSQKEALQVLPASTAGLIALLDWPDTDTDETSLHVAVLTAKR